MLRSMRDPKGLNPTLVDMADAIKREGEDKGSLEDFFGHGNSTRRMTDGAAARDVSCETDNPRVPPDDEAPKRGIQQGIR